MKSYKITYWSRKFDCLVTWIGDAEDIHGAINKCCDELDLDQDMIQHVEKVAL